MIMNKKQQNSHPVSSFSFIFVFFSLLISKYSGDRQQKLFLRVHCSYYQRIKLFCQGEAQGKYQFSCLWS
jgi:hypothetical protein